MFSKYLKSLSKNDFPQEKIDDLIWNISHSNFYKDTIFVCGNGGSWSTAQHFVQDINKSTDSKAVHIGGNTALLTALGNDISFEDIFIEEYKKLNLFIDSSILVLISTSGESKNIIKLAKYVKENTPEIQYAITGTENCTLAKYVDHVIATPAETIYKVESIHSALLHYVIERVKNV